MNQSPNTLGSESPIQAPKGKAESPIQAPTSKGTRHAPPPAPPLPQNPQQSRSPEASPNLQGAQFVQSLQTLAGKSLQATKAQADQILADYRKGQAMIFADFTEQITGSTQAASQSVELVVQELEALQAAYQSGELVTLTAELIGTPITPSIGGTIDATAAALPSGE